MFICLDEKLKNPVFEETESRLYRKDDYLYKIYKRKQSSFYHLINLIGRQENIKKTIFPDKILYKNNLSNDKILLGCRIKFFANGTPLNTLDMSLGQKLTVLEELISCLIELLDNYIYPKDLNCSNVLYDGKIRIIDLDTHDTKITDYEDKESYLFVLKLFRAVLFRTIYDDYDSLEPPKDIEGYLESKGIDKKIIKDIIRDNLDFNDAHNFIYSLKK